MQAVLDAALAQLAGYRTSVALQLAAAVNPAPLQSSAWGSSGLLWQEPGG